MNSGRKKVFGRAVRPAGVIRTGFMRLSHWLARSSGCPESAGGLWADWACGVRQGARIWDCASRRGSGRFPRVIGVKTVRGAAGSRKQVRFCEKRTFCGRAAYETPLSL